MTPTTVRMVLVEGDKADGSIVDHDVFDVTAADGTATSSNAAEQVVEAVLGTKESAAEGGHHLKSIGVTWSDHAEASILRDTLAARGLRPGRHAGRAGHGRGQARLRRPRRWRPRPGRRPGGGIRDHRAAVHRP